MATSDKALVDTPGAPPALLPADATLVAVAPKDPATLPAALKWVELPSDYYGVVEGDTGGATLVKSMVGVGGTPVGTPTRTPAVNADTMVRVVVRVVTTLKGQGVDVPV